MEEKNTTSITLEFIFVALLRKILVIILAAVVGAVAAFSFSKFLINPKYRSQVYFTVSVFGEEKIPTSSLTTSTMSAAEQLIQTLVVVIPKSDMYKQIADELNVSPALVSSSISLLGQTNTFILLASVETEDAELSYNIADALAKRLPAYQESIEMGSSSVCSTPEIAKSPSSPNVTKYTIIGMLAGAVISALFVLAFALMDKTVKGREDVERITDTPVLSEIPTLNEENKKAPRLSSRAKKLKSLHSLVNTDDILNDKTKFAISEAYKQLRTNLIFTTSVSSKNTIIVSSGLPNEGKSTTSCNIAISMAQNDLKILLVDADMRKPTIHKKLSLDNRTGLSNLLSGTDTFENVLHKEVRPNLDVLTSGVLPPNPAELLASKQMDDFIDFVSSKYDYVIFDTPPILVVTDARNFMTKTAGVLLVLRQNVTNYNEISAVLQSVKTAESNVIGLTVTDVDNKKKIYGGYYYYGHYYYKYGYYSRYAEYSTENRKVDLHND